MRSVLSRTTSFVSEGNAAPRLIHVSMFAVRDGWELTWFMPANKAVDQVDDNISIRRRSLRDRKDIAKANETKGERGMYPWRQSR